MISFSDLNSFLTQPNHLKSPPFAVTAPSMVQGFEMAVDSPISAGEALDLFSSEGEAFYRLLARAGAARKALSGNLVKLCGIINAKSGRCGEDCAFCAQSSRYATDIPVYPLVTASEILKQSRALWETGVREFSIVTSGKSVRSQDELSEILEAISQMKHDGLVSRCASLGILPAGIMTRLKEAGLNKYHHNLETSRSHFAAVCTTHDYEEDIATIHAASDAGLEVCAGALFGLGETRAQRVELAETLRSLPVDSVPINFLTPIPGTPLEGSLDLTPMECLKIIAVFRLMLPSKDLYICGGREHNLREIQSWIFMAGANGLMVGNYLTTSGRSIDLDLQMLKDQGLEARTGEGT
jgi:biotin synthase